MEGGPLLPMMGDGGLRPPNHNMDFEDDYDRFNRIGGTNYLDDRFHLEGGSRGGNYFDQRTEDTGSGDDVTISVIINVQDHSDPGGTAKPIQEVRLRGNLQNMGAFEVPHIMQQSDVQFGHYTVYTYTFQGGGGELKKEIISNGKTGFRCEFEIFLNDGMETKLIEAGNPYGDASRSGGKSSAGGGAGAAAAANTADPDDVMGLEPGNPGPGPALPLGNRPGGPGGNRNNDDNEARSAKCHHSLKGFHNRYFFRWNHYDPFGSVIPQSMLHHYSSAGDKQGPGAAGGQGSSSSSAGAGNLLPNVGLGALHGLGAASSSSPEKVLESLKVERKNAYVINLAQLFYELEHMKISSAVFMNSFLSLEAHFKPVHSNSAEHAEQMRSADGHLGGLGGRRGIGLGGGGGRDYNSRMGGMGGGGRQGPGDRRDRRAGGGRGGLLDEMNAGGFGDAEAPFQGLYSSAAGAEGLGGGRGTNRLGPGGAGGFQGLQFDAPAPTYEIFQETLFNYTLDEGQGGGKMTAAMKQFGGDGTSNLPKSEYMPPQREEMSLLELLRSQKFPNMRVGPRAGPERALILVTMMGFFVHSAPKSGTFGSVGPSGTHLHPAVDGLGPRAAGSSGGFLGGLFGGAGGGSSLNAAGGSGQAALSPDELQKLELVRTPRFPEVWAHYFISMLPPNPAQQLNRQEYVDEELVDHYKNLLGSTRAVNHYLTSGLKELVKANYKESGDYAFLRILPLLQAFRVAPSPIYSTQFLPKLKQRAERSFSIRCGEALDDIARDYGAAHSGGAQGVGESSRLEELWRSVAAQERRDEIERNDLLPRYFQMVERVAPFIEFCPSIQFLVAKILAHLPERIVWMVDDTANTRLLNCRRDVDGAQPMADGERHPLFKGPACYLMQHRDAYGTALGYGGYGGGYGGGGGSTAWDWRLILTRLRRECRNYGANARTEVGGAGGSRNAAAGGGNQRAAGAGRGRGGQNAQGGGHASDQSGMAYSSDPGFFRGWAFSLNSGGGNYKFSSLATYDEHEAVQRQLFLTPLMGCVLHFLENYDIREPSDIQHLRELCAKFSYTSATVYSILRNNATFYSLPVNSVVQLLSIPSDADASTRCRSALLDWIRNKYGGKVSASQHAHHLVLSAEKASETKDKMRETFVAFSHFLSCSKIARWKNKLLEEVSQFWFFTQESIRVVTTVLAIENSFSWTRNSISPHEQLITSDVTQKILTTTRKVVCDAYDEDPSLLRTILKEPTTFRFELLNRILEHRIEGNRINLHSRLGGGNFDATSLAYSGDGVSGAIQQSSPVGGAAGVVALPLPLDHRGHQGSTSSNTAFSASIEFLSPYLKEAGLIIQLVNTYDKGDSQQDFRASGLGLRIQRIKRLLTQFLNRVLTAEVHLSELHDVVKEHKWQGFYRLAGCFELRVDELMQPGGAAVPGAPATTTAGSTNSFRQELLRSIPKDIVDAVQHDSLRHNNRFPEGLGHYAGGETVFEITELRQKQLEKFDAELLQFSTYVKLYCKSAQIECSHLNQKVETLLKRYGGKTLASTVDEFVDEKVLKYARKLFDLRQSELFLDIWNNIGKQIHEHGSVHAGMIMGTNGALLGLGGGAAARSGTHHGGKSRTASEALGADESGAGAGATAGGGGKMNNKAAGQDVGGATAHLANGGSSGSILINGIIRPERASTRELQRQNSSGGNSVNKETLAAEEFGIEFKALDDQVPVLGLCREIPVADLGSGTASASSASTAYTMTLWDVETQKPLATAVVTDTSESSKLDGGRFIQGSFSCGPVFLKKGKRYRISAQNESGDTGKFQSDFTWCSYSSSSRDQAGTPTARDSGRGLVDVSLKNGLGLFSAVCFGVRKGGYPASVTQKSKRGPSVGIVVNREELLKQAEKTESLELMGTSGGSSPGKMTGAAGGVATLVPKGRSSGFGMNAGGATSLIPVSTHLPGASSGGSKLKKQYVEIAQDVAVSDIIPTAFRQWDDLAEQLILGSQDLETGFKLFGVLGNRRQKTLSAHNLKKEIELLERMTDVIDGKHKGLENLKQHPNYSRRKETNDLRSSKNWSATALLDIAELRFLERLAQWIPGMLKFYHAARPFLFPHAADDDSYIKSLEHCANVITSARNTWVLGVVAYEVQPYKKLLESISADHQDFITSFATRRETLLWLFSHTDGDAFDKKIRLVRPCTDDDVLLRALSNLSELRRIVSGLFYQGEGERDLDLVMQEAVAEFSQGGIDDDVAGREKNVAQEYAPATVVVDEKRIDLVSASAAEGDKAAAETDAAPAARPCRQYANLEEFLKIYTAQLKFKPQGNLNSQMLSHGGAIVLNVSGGVVQQQQHSAEFAVSEEWVCLDVVITSWDRLHDLLERNTLSPGVKACREVKPMVLRGLFIFHGTADTNFQLVCKLPNADVRFEQLAETRRLLLMTEPPEEEEEEGAAGADGSGKMGSGSSGTGAGAENQNADSEMEDAADIAALEQIPIEELKNSNLLVLDENSPFSPEQRAAWKRDAERQVKKMKLKDLVEDFVNKLEVMEDLRHLVADLHNNGHFDYAHGAVLQISPLESIQALKKKKQELQQTLSEWMMNMRNIRGEYYCLNFFVVKHLQSLRDDIRNVEASFWEKGCLPLRENYSDEELKTDFFRLLTEKGKLDRAIEMYGNDARTGAVSTTTALGGPATVDVEMDAAAPDAGGNRTDINAEAAALVNAKASDAELLPGEFLSTIDRLVDVRHFISGERLADGFTSVTALALSNTLDSCSEVLVRFCKTLLQCFHGLGRFPRTSATEQIHYIGKMLDDCFGKIPYREKKVPWISERAAKHFSKQKLQQGDLLIQEINIPSSQQMDMKSGGKNRRSAAFNARPASRERLLPAVDEDKMEDVSSLLTVDHQAGTAGGAGAAADEAIRGRKAEKDHESYHNPKTLPIFACTTPSEEEVVGLVLSLYFRRERLPEPQEVLLCTEMTGVEEIEILVRRFIQARVYGREKCVFCIGNIQLLSYQIQCRAVEMLGVLLSEYGVANSAALVLVSGLPNQMLLNAATSQCGVQYINVSSLSALELQLCLKHAVPTVSAAFGRDINGCGKTDFILREAYAIQDAKGHTHSVYRKLAIRENTDKKEVIQQAHEIADRQKIEERDDAEFVHVNFRARGVPREKIPWVQDGAKSKNRGAGVLPSDGLHGDGAQGGGAGASTTDIAGGAVSMAAASSSSTGSPTETGNSAAAAEQQKLVNAQYDHLVHLDLAHIVQKRANIVLFELLCLGCVVDPLSSTMYFRSPKDRYIVEIPGTPGNQLLKHLSVLPLLKKETLKVEEATLSLNRPQFLGPTMNRMGRQEWGIEVGTRTQFIHIVRNEDILLTCKFLKALQDKRFTKTQDEDPAAQNDQTLLREQISPSECWRLLYEQCCPAGQEVAAGASEKRQQPSFLLFNFFAKFMRNQFDRTMSFALLTPRLSRQMGLFQLRDIFCTLLVKTSQDFALRQVPRFESLEQQAVKLEEDLVMADLQLSPKRTPTAAPGSGGPSALLEAAAGSSGKKKDDGQAGGGEAMDVDYMEGTTPQAVSSGTQPAAPVPASNGSTAPAAQAEPAESSSNPALQRQTSRGSIIGTTGAAASSSSVPRAAAAGAASMDRRSRHEMTPQEARTTALGAERFGVGKVSAENLAERFSSMTSWECKDHPLAIFKLSKPNKVSGIDIVSLNEETIKSQISLERQFIRSLDNNGLRVLHDWSKASPDQCAKLVRAAKGLEQNVPGGPVAGQRTAGPHAQIPAGLVAQRTTAVQPSAAQHAHKTLGRTHYVLTIDNLLKILNILLRLEYGLPTIIMGETGCGKTALVEFICDMLHFPLKKLDLHGGITDQEITRFFKECKKEAAKLDKNDYLVAFLDEINAANCMAHCKTLIVDRFVDNERLPSNIRIVACCNPYRIRKNKESEVMGLVYQHHFADGGIVSRTDHMKKLVYRVHQLPESLIDIVSDFGALTDATESLYIDAILKKELPFMLVLDLRALPDGDDREHAIYLSRKAYEQFIATFGTLLRKSQGYIREISNNERSVVSLRDIARATRVFRWFLKHYTRHYASLSGGGATASSAVATTGADDGGIGGPSPEHRRRGGTGVRQDKTQAELRASIEGSHFMISAPDQASNADRSLPKDEPLRTSLVGTKALSTAVLLTLGFCYHSRLAREDRDGYHKRVFETTRTDNEIPVAPARTSDPGAGGQMQRHGAAGGAAAAAGGGYPHQGANIVQSSGREQADQNSQGNNAPVKALSRDFAWLKLQTENTFLGVVEAAQKAFVQQMHLGEGIALNEALRENLFMLLVSVMNQIPIFVIGKPGCSKSLAVSILQDNLKGSVSEKALFKTMPAIEVLPYQCSPLSTADGIQNAFDNARKYQGGGDGTKTVVVVLLDEVGLAEESPHLPLKVLHKELERPGKGITCIGISNWALDAAKMSRAVHLYRSPPTIDDLTLTAEGMIHQSGQLRMYLRSLAEAFHAIYQEQPRQDFWGLREFYSTVRVVNAELKARAARNEQQNLDADCLMKTVLRNFGGCTVAEMETNITKFFSKVGMRPEDGKRYTVTELIKQNLEEADARHLMLLTKNNSALRLLFDSGVVSYEQGTEVLFGSSFPDDQSDVMVATNLNKIRSMMTKPIQLVLIHCDALYESLYDLLNQHYMEFSGQRYVRIAHGSSSKQCPIHHKFRVIVIVEKTDAWTRLAPPLLNRFEKQIFVRSQLLTAKEDKLLLERLEEWLALLVRDVMSQTNEGSSSSSNAVQDKQTAANRQHSKNGGRNRKRPQPLGGGGYNDINAIKRRCIPGFHSDILPSLVVSLNRLHVTGLDTTGLSPTPAMMGQGLSPRGVVPGAGNGTSPASPDLVEGTNEADIDTNMLDQTSQIEQYPMSLSDKLGRALHDLCWVLTPECVTAHMAAVQAGTSACHLKFNPKEHPAYPNIGEEYFRSQQHGDLRQFVEGLEDAYVNVKRELATGIERRDKDSDVVMHGMEMVDGQGDAIMEDVTSVQAQADSSSSATSSFAVSSGAVGEFLGGKGRSVGGMPASSLHQMARDGDLGSQVMCMTYTPMIGGSVLADVLRTEERPVSHFLLHTLSSSSELESKVEEFYFSKWSHTAAVSPTEDFSASGGAADDVNMSASEQAPAASRRNPDRAMADFLNRKNLLDGDRRDTRAPSSSPFSAKHDYLLIEADPIASSERQIEQCRFICENYLHKYQEKCKEEQRKELGQETVDGDEDSYGAVKKHVLLVVHLSRSRTETSRFLLDFDRRWRAIFIDSVGLAEKSGLPDLTQMLNRNLRDVFDLVDFQYVLTNQCLRPSLARLVYPSRRAASALTQQIAMLLQLCRSDGFVGLLSELIQTVLDRFQREEDLKYSRRVKDEQQRILKQTGNAAANALMSPRELGPGVDAESYSLAVQTVVKKTWYSDDFEGMTKSGTFCGGLHYRLLRILQSLIAKMLAFFDRNHGLQLFAKYPSACLPLAHFVIKDPNCKLAIDMLNALLVGGKENPQQNSFEEVLNDTRSERAPFHALFPFSYFIAQTIDQRRVLVQNKLGETTDVFDHGDKDGSSSRGPGRLVQAISTSFNVPIAPEFAKSGISNLRYLKDYIAMSVPKTSTLPRWSQTLLLLALCRKSFGIRDGEEALLNEATQKLAACSVAAASSSGSCYNSDDVKMGTDPTTAANASPTATAAAGMLENNEGNEAANVSFPTLKFPPSLFEVHIGYWLNEKRMFFLSEILSCCPSALDRVLEAIQREIEWDADERKAAAEFFQSTSSTAGAPSGIKTDGSGLPYTQNQRALGFSTLLASIVIDHLVAELLEVMPRNSSKTTQITASRFKYFSDWTERAHSLLQQVQDLLQDSYQLELAAPADAATIAQKLPPTLQKVYTLLQNRVSFFRSVKVLKLELISVCLRKLSIDCHNTAMDLAPLLQFVKTRDTFDKTHPEQPAEHEKSHTKLSFRDIRVVEHLLLGFADVMRQNSDYVQHTNYYALERGTSQTGGRPATALTLGTSTMAASSSGASGSAGQPAHLSYEPPVRALSSASNSSREGENTNLNTYTTTRPPANRSLAKTASVSGSASSSLSAQLRKKFGEVLEWLYLDGWLLAEGTAGANAYLLGHLPVDLLKHLCCHASGRPCTIRHNSVVPHDTHDPTAIALIPGSSPGQQEVVPCTMTFILALLRKLRRLSSPVIEQEIRALLQRAQEKNKSKCRDTQFAWSVAIIEEEIEREKILAAIDSMSSIDSSAVVNANGTTATAAAVTSTSFGASRSTTSKDDDSISPIGRPLKKLKLSFDLDDVLNAKVELGKLYLEAEKDPKKLLDKLRGVAKFRALLSHYMIKVRGDYFKAESVGMESSAEASSPDSVPLATQKIAETCEYELLNQDEASRANPSGEPTFCIRSARMLALKQWERSGGSSELQVAMVAPPLAKIEWFEKWRNEGTAQDLQGYLGGSKLPKWNPYHDFFLLESQTREYEIAEGLVSAYALHCDSSSLESHLRNMQQQPLDQQRRMMGALILRFATIGVQRAVTQPVDHERQLCRWTRTCESFTATTAVLADSFPLGYVNLLLYFLHDEALKGYYVERMNETNLLKEQQNLNAAHMISQWDYFFLSSTHSTTEQIAQFRFLPHFLAVVWSAPKNSVLHFFRELMENPKPWGSGVEVEKAWLPAMEVDIREVATTALKETKIGQSRFCVCPNGHPYYIGDCGQAFTKGHCPECGEEIGGGGHELLKTNKRMLNDDQSAPGYTHPVDYSAIEAAALKPKPAAKGFYTPRRDLNNMSYVCLARLFTHAAMWCGLVMKSQKVIDNVLQTGGAVQAATSGNLSNAQGGSGGAAPAQQQSSSSSSSSAGPGAANVNRGSFYAQIVNKDYVQLNRVADEMAWVKHQLVLDWRFLPEFLSCNAEEVTKLLHILIDRMHKRPEQVNPNTVPDEGDDPNANPSSNRRISIEEARRNELAKEWVMPFSRDDRKAWETVFVNAYLEELVPNTGLARNELAEADMRWKNVDGPFLVELKENYEISSYAIEKRHKEETLLWSYRGDPTLDLLQQRTTTALNPILSHLFKIHHQFECLEHLSDVLQFQRFVASFYSHRKTRQEAQNMTVGMMFDEVRQMSYDTSAGGGQHKHESSPRTAAGNTNTSAGDDDVPMGVAVGGSGPSASSSAAGATGGFVPSSATASVSGAEKENKDKSQNLNLLENLELWFEGFAKAWNNGFGSWVKRWECTHIPEAYLSLKMTKATKLIFCLASDEGEGICPLALVQTMCEAHNGFLELIRDQEKQLVRRNYKTNRRRERGSLAVKDGEDVLMGDALDEDNLDEEENISALLAEIDSKEISTRDLVHRSECLSFSLDDLLSWVKDRAIRFMEGGKIDFDMEKIETYLVDCFQAKRKLKLELKMVRFTFQDLTNVSSNVNNLRAKMLAAAGGSAVVSSSGATSTNGAVSTIVAGTKPLSPEDVATLRSHFGNNSIFAENFQRHLDLVASFLLKTIDFSSSSSASAAGAGATPSPTSGSTATADQPYVQYCEKVLMLEEGRIQDVCGAAVMPVVKRMKLRHVMDVLEILENLASDIFDKIPPQFKTDLPKNLIDGKLKELKEKSDLSVLIPSLKDYITDKMQADTRKPEHDLRSWLSYMDVGEQTLEEFDWFENYFPDDLEHRYAVSLYHFLNESGNFGEDEEAGEREVGKEEDGLGGIASSPKLRETRGGLGLMDD